MKTIVFATGNQNKVFELSGLFKDKINILSLKEVNIIEEYEETGFTFEENSLGKAIFYSKLTDYLVIADDSGLEIDYFDGEPGIYSARYINPKMPYIQRCEIILDKLKNIEKKKRKARFKCSASCALKGEKVACSNGTVEGEISFEIKGNDGFGYDPIFFYPPFGKTFAEIELSLKNTISHRFNAFTKLYKLIEDKLK